MKKVWLYVGVAVIFLLLAASVASNVIVAKRLWEIDDVTEFDIAKFNSKRQERANQFLEAARQAKNDSEKAKILYLSALNYSNEKLPILSEYIDWQKQEIQTALNDNKAELAQEYLIALAGICDVNIASGSLADINSIPALKEKLSSAEKQIKDYREKQISAQREKITEFDGKIANVSTYDGAETLINELSELAVDSSLEDTKDAVIAKLVVRQSCLTKPNQPIMIPAINDETPWCAWLNNFIDRLKSADLPVEKKLEDIGAVADFIAAAKASGIDGVDRLITTLEEVARGIYITFWQERAERITSTSNPSVNDVSALLAENNDFNSNELKSCEEQIVKLNKCLVQAALNEFGDGLKTLKALENTVADETYMQMVGATQSQYIQLLIKLKALDAKHSGGFDTEISDVTQKTAYLGQLLSSYKNKLAISEIRKSEGQRLKFVAWAKNQLDCAKRLDDEGESVANEYLATRSNERAVNKYVEAWQTLMSVHPGDLQSADPAMYQKYSELKQLIENHWSPNNYQRNLVKYKRIFDF